METMGVETQGETPSAQWAQEPVSGETWAGVDWT